MYILEHSWGCCDEHGYGTDMDEYETLEEARKHAVKGDRILEVVEEIK